MRILVLGGTAEARALAVLLHEAGLGFESSLAGRVSRPRLPVGPVRIGGFGGVEGLTTYLRQHEVTHLVDATHPFAATMSAHAVVAGAAAGIPVVRLARPGWGDRPDAAAWHWVASIDEARDIAEQLGRRPFISSGRQTLPAFAAWAGRPVLVRVVEPLDESAPAGWTVIEDRGPYNVAGERKLLQDHEIDVLVTKDSGGAYTSAKLDAAAQLGVPVVAVSRPAPPTGAIVVASAADCLAWLSDARGATPN